MKPYFISDDKNFILYNGDNLKVISDIKYDIDLIFADPPYFLSGGGDTCSNGQRVSVNKGDWDKKTDISNIYTFNKKWIKKYTSKLKNTGSLWISGTHHNIFAVGYIIQENNLHIMNNVVWQKPNPPPNLSCKYFTHSNESILWVVKNKKDYTFNYSNIKAINNNKQMKDVWKISPPLKAEKIHGKHPTQKPLALMDIIIRATSIKNDWVLDPFCGSGTTGISAYKMGRKFIGIDKDSKYLDIAIKRFKDIK